MLELLHQPAAAQGFSGVARLLQHGQAQALGPAEDLHGLIRRPAAVGIEVDLGVRAEPLTQHMAGLDVEGERPPADLQLEGVDAVRFAEPQRFLEELRGGLEAEHVGDPHAVGEAAQQFVHRGAQRDPDDIPERDVQGPLGRGVVDRAPEQLLDL